MAHLIRSSTLSGYKELTASLGGNPTELLQAYHIDPAILDRDDAFLPLRSFVQLLEATALKANCPDFGLRLGGSQDIRILGPIAVAMQNAETLGEALQCASTYLFAVSPGIQFSLFSQSAVLPKWAEMRYEVNSPRATVRQALDVGLAVAHGISRMLAPNTYRVEQVHLSHTPLAPLKAYKNHFSAPVKKEQSSSSLFVNPDCLNTRIHDSNDFLQQLVTNYLDVEFPRPGQTFSARIQQAITRSIETGNSDKESIARMMAMHPRTLQRRLSEEHTSFDEIRDEVRKKLTLHYLTTSEVALSQLAGLVGFSEHSALSRACRRWFNCSPSAIRAGDLPR